MLRWMAPFLSFTAEEAWKIFNGGETIFTETYWDFAGAEQTDLRPSGPPSAKCAIWSTRHRSRSHRWQVGASLQAEITLTAMADDHAILSSLGDDLEFVLIVSKVKLVQGEALAVAVTPSRPPSASAAGTTVTTSASTPNTQPCGRCDSNLHGAGEHREHA